MGEGGRKDYIYTYIHMYIYISYFKIIYMGYIPPQSIIRIEAKIKGGPFHIYIHRYISLNVMAESKFKAEGVYSFIFSKSASKLNDHILNAIQNLWPQTFRWVFNNSHIQLAQRPFFLKKIFFLKRLRNA